MHSERKTSGDPLVGVVIVGWNNRDIIEDCLKSVKKQTYKKIRTMYIDNDSKDNSVELVKTRFPWVEVIESEKNVGFAKGNNIVIKELLKDANVKYILLLNSDARLNARWLEEVINFAGQKVKSAFFQGKTLDYYEQEIIDSTHIYIAQNGQGTQGNWRKIDIGNDNPHKVFGVNAAACLINRDFIERQPFMNLFDEEFFMYLEDLDLSTRATVMGWDNYYVPKAHAYHMGSASSGKNPNFSLYMTYKNNLAMIVKNYPIRLVIKLLPKMLMSDFRTAKGLFKIKQYKAAMKIYEGRFMGMILLPRYFLKAYKISKTRHIDCGYLWQLMREGY